MQNGKVRASVSLSQYLQAQFPLDNTYDSFSVVLFSWRPAPAVPTLKLGSRSEIVSARHKSAVSTNLQPQFFPERLAFLEALEELI